MAIPVFDYGQLSPEGVNPFSNVLSHAIDTYSKSLKTSYLPQQIEADIFSKEISPVATLASSPLFQGFSPEVRNQIAEKISSYLSHGQSGVQPNGPTAPGFPNPLDIYHRLKKHTEIVEGPGGKLKTGGSRLAGEARKFGIDIGDSGYADTAAQEEQDIADAAQYLSLKGYTTSQIDTILSKKPGESGKSRAERLKQYFAQPGYEDISDEEITESPVSAASRMIGPDGKTYFVPAKNVKKFIADGGRHAD